MDGKCLPAAEPKAAPLDELPASLSYDDDEKKDKDKKKKKKKKK